MRQIIIFNSLLFNKIAREINSKHVLKTIKTQIYRLY